MTSLFDRGDLRTSLADLFAGDKLNGPPVCGGRSPFFPKNRPRIALILKFTGAQLLQQPRRKTSTVFPFFYCLKSVLFQGAGRTCQRFSRFRRFANFMIFVLKYRCTCSHLFKTTFLWREVSCTLRVYVGRKNFWIVEINVPNFIYVMNSYFEKTYINREEEKSYPWLFYRASSNYVWCETNFRLVRNRFEKLPSQIFLSKGKIKLTIDKIFKICDFFLITDTYHENKFFNFQCFLQLKVWVI